MTEIPNRFLVKLQEIDDITTAVMGDLMFKKNISPIQLLLVASIIASRVIETSPPCIVGGLEKEALKIVHQSMMIYLSNVYSAVAPTVKQTLEEARNKIFTEEETKNMLSEVLAKAVKKEG